jgi:uncharacterized protein YndB with AHSA1/START domain
MKQFQSITIQARVNAPMEKIWKCWNLPEHIMQWNHASDDWHTTAAKNDLRPGGVFLFRMEAKDGSYGFDFSGVYDEVIPFEKIAYTMGDERKVVIKFSVEDNRTNIVMTFDAEDENSLEMQEAGWQSILNHFKSYVEAL